MDYSARLFNCAHCHHSVVICSHCDRNNIYCSANCSEFVRRKSLLAAGKRYQNSLKGRLKHANRQRLYRWRKNKVTHHTSPISPANVSLTPQPNEQKTVTAQPIAKIVRCDFCGRSCSLFLRHSFLRRQIDQKARYSAYLSRGS